MDGARPQQLIAQEPQAAEQQGAQKALGVAADRHAPDSIVGFSLTTSVWLGDAFAIFLVRNVVMRQCASNDHLRGALLMLSDALSIVLVLFSSIWTNPVGWVIGKLA